MSVRCKYKCESVNYTVDGAKIVMVPVISGSKENETFFKYTPWGKFEMGTVNLDAAATFIPGQDYYIDISAA